MSSITQTRSAVRPASVSLKAWMAVTGAVMAAWLTLHMLGNLLVFAGPEVMNAYALKLRETGLLWPMRLVLVLALSVHAVCATLTARQGLAARPQRYRVRLRHHASNLSARTMRLGGVLVLAWLAYHVPQQYGWGPGHVPGDAYHNLVRVLHEPLHASVYVLATAVVASHLAHGLESALITLGIVPGRRRMLVTRALRTWVWIVTLGFGVEALAAVLGFVR